MVVDVDVDGLVEVVLEEVVLVEVVLVEVGLVVVVDEVVDVLVGAVVVVSLGTLVVGVDGSEVVVVVGSEGGGGRGGKSMSRSGKVSWEQSIGTPVSPSTKLQYSSWHPVRVVLDSATASSSTDLRGRPFRPVMIMVASSVRGRERVGQAFHAEQRAATPEMGLSALFGRKVAREDWRQTHTSVWRGGYGAESTGRQVDYLFRAVAEARRQRAQDEDRRVVERDVRSLDPYRAGDGFVTEWQSAEGVSLSR